MSLSLHAVKEGRTAFRTIVHRFSPTLFVAAAFFLFLHARPTAARSETTSSSRHLRVVASPYEPFITVKDSTIKGFDVDLLNFICALNNWTYSIRLVPFNEMFRLLQQDSADIAIGAIYRTDMRKKYFRFSTSYLKTGLVIVSRSEHPVSHFKNLDGKRIGVKHNATGEQVARELMMKNNIVCTIVPFASTEESFEALNHGTVDAVLNDYINSQFLISKHYSGEFTISSSLFGPHLLSEDYLSFPVSRSFSPHLDSLNSALDQIEKGGLVENLQHKWLINTFFYDWATIAKYFALFFVLVLSFILIGTRIYQRNKNAQIEKKYLEEKLILSSAIEHTGDSVMVVNRNGIIEYVNPAFESSTGYSRSEAVGQTPQILRSGIHSKEFFTTMWDTLIAGKTWKGSVVNKKKNGEHFIADEIIAPIFNSTGTITHFVATLRDITERNKAEKALRQQTDIYEGLLKAQSDVGEGFIIAEGKKILYANEAFCRTCGYSLQELQALDSFYSIVVPEQREMLNTRRLRSIEGEGVQEHYEATIFHKNRMQVDLEISRKNVMVEGRTQIIVITRNISLRKEAELALRRSEEQYRRFFEDDLTGDFIAGADGTIKAYNPAFITMFGFETSDKAAPFNLASLYPTPEAYHSLIATLCEKQKLEYLSTELRRNDGKPVYVIQNVIGMFDETGALREIKGYIFDDTPRKNLEEQLLQSQKMESIGTLAGGIAHDFNNVLAMILTSAELLKNQSKDRPQLYRYADIIATSAQRGAAIAKQLLLFARSERGEMQPIHISKVVKEVQQLLEHSFPKSILVTTSLRTDNDTVLGDSAHLHQVLLNLAINARDAMPSGGTMNVTVDFLSKEQLPMNAPVQLNAAHFVTVAITDTGTGMDINTKKRIFEPFFSTKQRGKGTGLGLAIVYGIVQNHNGWINVSSTVGKGTAFTMYFPAITDAEVETAKLPAAEIDHHQGNETILVVDDEESIREMLGEVLRSAGYNVLTAENGLEAVTTYQKHKQTIALVVSDIGMPHMDGEELFWRLKTLDEKVKVIIMTGYLNQDSKNAILDIGVKGVVTKPFNLQEILRVVQRTLNEV